MTTFRRLKLNLAPAALLLFFLLVPAVAFAQQSVTVKLEPVNGSAVTGTVILTANGDATDAVVDLKNLPPGADGLINLYANTCALPSASFAFIANFSADANGSVHLTAPVLFHNTNVTLPEITTSNIIAVYSGGQMVSCGTVPPLVPAVPSATLPATGGAFYAAMPLLFGIVGALLIAGSLFVLRHVRTI